MKLKLPLIAAFVTVLGLSACGGGSSGTTGTPGPVASPAAFSSVDETVGQGAQAVVGKQVQVNYTGWLYNATTGDGKGTQFGTSNGGSPFTFVLGAVPEQVIPGFDQGVIGMRVGGTRLVTIPSSMAYGSTGVGAIPPNSGVVYEIQLIDVL